MFIKLFLKIKQDCSASTYKTDKNIDSSKNWSQIGIKLGTKKVKYKPKVSKFNVEKKISMLTGLKVSSLV